MTERRALVFDCAGIPLVGVAELPVNPAATGLVIVTGGPQYRSGSHRLFTTIARSAAAKRNAAITFDFRGSGDSTGDHPGFESLDDDLAAAIDALCTASGVNRVVILGLCDAASAASMYAARDSRVAGLVLLNPWVRSEGSLERARVKNYYPARLGSAGFWKRLLTGKVRVLHALRSYRQQAGAARAAPRADDFVGRMLAGVRSFTGPVLLVLSGQDMTAREFSDLCENDADWRQTAETRFDRHELPGASHTFAGHEQTDALVGLVTEFLAKLDS